MGRHPHGDGIVTASQQLRHTRARRYQPGVWSRPGRLYSRLHFRRWFSDIAIKSRLVISDENHPFGNSSALDSNDAFDCPRIERITANSITRFRRVGHNAAVTDNFGSLFSGKQSQISPGQIAGRPGMM